MLNRTLLFICSFIAIKSFSQTCIGPNSPTAAVNELVTGSTGGAWTPLTNSFTSNNVYDVIANLSSANQYSDHLIVREFGFSLPVNAIISGITVTVERSVSGGAVIQDSSIMLVKNGVTQTATNRAIAGAWGTTDNIITYGNSTDLWGNTWTGADINNPNFGVAISAYRFVASGAPQNPRVDHVTVTVCYSGLLPVTLKQFEVAKDNDENAVISWTTSEEINVKSMEVERSHNGINFESIYKINGTGINSTSEKNYVIKDAFTFSGNNYYRLKVTDNNGAVTYSAIKSITLNSKKNNLTVAYTNGILGVSVNNISGKHTLQIFETSGKLLSQHVFTVTRPFVLTQLPVTLKTNKLYIVTVKGTKYQQTTKLYAANL